MDLQLTSNKNNIYHINIKLISKHIVFQIESMEIPKLLITNGYSISEMKEMNKFFSNFETIEYMFKQLENLLENIKIILLLN